MAARLKFLFLYFLTWIAFFELARLVFLFYHFSKARELPFSTAALSFFYGLRMDISMASYLLVPVCLFVLLGVFIPLFRKAIVYKVYTWLILFLVMLIVLSDLEVFRQWGFRIDATPLRFITSPREVWASISHLPVFLIFFLFTLAYVAVGLVFSRIISRIIPPVSGVKYPWLSVLVILLVTVSLIIPIRGGFQLAPLNQSSVYFSTYNFANIMAINAPWNFVHGVMNRTSSKNPYSYMDPARAKTITDSLYHSQNSNIQMLKTTKPNVLLIIWESFTSKAIHHQVEGKPVTPGFNELIKEGIYFSQAYASGDRTDKGIAAVLSGYPALNNVSVIRLPGKSSRLNTLGGFFSSMDYETSFYYGGEPEFANIKSYILQSHYRHLTGKDDFPARDQNSKWGAHDEVVARKLLKDLGNMRTPFFTTWLTLTSHEPFETPVPPVFPGLDRTTKFLNSLHYSDKVIYEFIQQCKQQPWWNNTVIVIVADHGHPLPEPNTPLDNFKIPMLLLGGALNKTGIEINNVVSQLDLATTLTGQMGGNRKLFPFSRNLFDSTGKPWAYFSFNNGFGLVQPGKAFVFDNVGKQVIATQGPVNDADIQAGKALQQQTFQDYSDK